MAKQGASSRPYSQLKAANIPYFTGKQAKNSNKGVSSVLDESVFPLARVRRLLLGDGAVTAVAKEGAMTVAKATELFITAFVRDAASTAQRRGAKRTITGADVATTARGVGPWKHILQFDFPEGSYAHDATPAHSGAASGKTASKDNTPAVSSAPTGGMASFLAGAPRMEGHAALFAAAPPIAPPTAQSRGGKVRSKRAGDTHSDEEIPEGDSAADITCASDEQSTHAAGGEGGAAAPSTGDAVLDAVRARKRKGKKTKQPAAASVEAGEGGVKDTKGASRRKSAKAALSSGGGAGGLGAFFKGGQSKEAAMAAAFAEVEGRDFAVEGGGKSKSKGGKKRGRAGAAPDDTEATHDSLQEGLQYDEDMDVDLAAVRAAYGKKKKRRSRPAPRLGAAERARAGRAASSSALSAAVMRGDYESDEHVDTSSDEEGGGEGGGSKPVSATAAEEDGDVIWPTGM